MFVFMEVMQILVYFILFYFSNDTEAVKLVLQPTFEKKEKKKKRAYTCKNCVLLQGAVFL